MDEVWKNLWEAFRENDDFFKIEQLVDDLQLIFLDCIR